MYSSRQKAGDFDRQVVCKREDGRPLLPEIPSRFRREKLYNGKPAVDLNRLYKRMPKEW